MVQISLDGISILPLLMSPMSKKKPWIRLTEAYSEMT